MAAPEGVVTNEELATKLGLEAEQIFKSSGIRRRRWAAPGTTTSSLAAAALEAALEDARLNVTDVDYLIFGTMTPDRFIPGSSPSTQKLLGLREIPCLDIRAACCNALYALQLARALVASGTAQRVAICLAEVQSAYLDISPAAGTTSMLFGDGAAALVVAGEAQAGALEIVDVHLATDGAYVDDLGMRSPGTEFGAAHTHDRATNAADYFPRMVGQSVILQASRKIVAASQALLQRNNLAATDVRWMVPHQANANLLAQVARGLKFPTDDGAVVSVIEEFGNTSSASMGIALDTLRRSGRIQAGDYLLLPAFGAGFTWGAGLCRAAAEAAPL
ncbi:MAG: 3-oxoacyl-[acyl-carrier-protein] synthase [Blastocatellia bacterium]|jgi:3-oxoacyl-(acyl-carrier-protein) synthase III|nr:3-oxoacyl-[acyl-carrier-protein] synthase [Blastocatellia bacterium]